MRAYLLLLIALASLSSGQETHPPKPKRRITVAHYEMGQYPLIAKQARIEGTVVLRLEFAGDRSLKNASVLSGHPILATSALEMAKKWKFLCFDCGYNEPFTHIFAVHYVQLVPNRACKTWSLPKEATVCTELGNAIQSASSN
jgi:TonB family protein